MHKMNSLKSFKGSSTDTDNGSLSQGSNTELDTDEEQLLKRMKAVILDEKCADVHFRKTDDFHNEYIIGDEVIPSADARHKEKKAVVYATMRDRSSKSSADHNRSRSAGRHEDVILKWRHKQLSFKDQQEDRDWVRHMRYLHKLTYLEFKETAHAQSSSLPLAPKKRNHLARVPDIAEDAKYYYVVMEKVKGRDMFDWFVQERIHERSYKHTMARDMAVHILLGLQQLHDAGLIHRDIKLENIVLDERKVKQQGLKTLQCDLKIIDYDTVICYNPGVKSFHVLGTDQYIAPESYIGQSSPASDMWALGVCLYVIVTGTFPFHAALFDDQPGENYVGHVKMDTIRRRLRLARIDWSGSCWKNEPLAKDFCRRCFHCDDRRRLSVKQAFEHRWIIEGMLEQRERAEEFASSLGGLSSSGRRRSSDNNNNGRTSKQSRDASVDRAQKAGSSGGTKPGSAGGEKKAGEMKKSPSFMKMLISSSGSASS